MHELEHVYCVDGVLDSIVDLYKCGNIDNLGVYIAEHETTTTRFILIREQMVIRSLGYVDEIFVRKQLDIIFPLQGFANSVSDYRYTALQSITTQFF